MKAYLLMLGLFMMLITQAVPAKDNRWIINGNVANKASQLPLVGLRVTAYDKDIMQDDILGRAITDQLGNFRIAFRSRDFEDEKNEKSPVIYIRIRNRKGQLIYTSKKNPIFNPKHNEYHRIYIGSGKKKRIYRRRKNTRIKIYNKRGPVIKGIKAGEGVKN